ncbi:putrescine aminotransferase [Melghiribacillus thermohalophilus]|uniref:Putrescine aminotransferase n=1 Tax=Melghiribacillus thermohalophilus TaxID=1324956 RepID=A0A4V2V213_9BACI|nr:aspartate aminotransferase family protein [Melghiribacillus thermohalophilus]TCT23322.1 putrescine aminotransferase [Melghiribacillus thermohalophilus]
MNQLQLINELIELDQNHFLHPTSSIKQQQEEGPAAIFTEGKGIYVTDLSGKTYIEGMSSLWNVHVGYGRKELAETARAQMEKLAFSNCFSTFSNEPAIRLAKKIADMTPGDLQAVFFTSGGSEANDTAYKLAQYYWKLKGFPNKTKIISRKQAYHGLAVGSTSATGISAFHTMTPSPSPEFIHIDPFSAEELEQVIQQEGEEHIAAFIAEPVQGAGGVHIPPPDYLENVRKICDKYNVLMIADEVITGFGRTGKMFACEHWNVVPDFMLFAKGVTSGYMPLGGVVIRQPIHEDLKELAKGTLLHGFTYSGHPVSCAVGLHNIDIIEEEKLVENSRTAGEEMKYHLQQIQDEIPYVGDVRSLGLIGGLEIMKNPETNERFTEKISPLIVKEARNRGLILRNVVFEEADTIVFAPPLIIQGEEIMTLFSILKDSILAVLNH